jgi:glutaredoxin 3
MKNVIVYTKTGCPWCVKMLNFLNSKNIEYTEKNVTNSSELFEEMKQISGQDKAPTLNIDGEIVADADVSDVEKFFH